MNRSSLSSHVAETIRSQKLLSRNDSIIVALSGGADSCALLDLLTGLSNLSPRIVVAHINHCLRGAESDADEDFARSLATGYRLQFESCRINVADLAEQQGLNLEDAGRRARRDFLEQVRTKYRAHAVALAHHADDQAETVLMRLLRGSGMTGLSGMAFRNGYLIRPLLDVSRHEIERYLESRGLSYREDASNRDTRFLRNRIRHELLPTLTDYNPNIRTRLITTARLLADENSMLDQMAADRLDESGTFHEGALSLSLELLATQPVALKRRIIRLAFGLIAGNCDHFNNQHIEAVLQLADGERPNSRVNLAQGINAVRSYGILTIQHAPQPFINQDEEMTVDCTGIHQLPNGSTLEISFSPDMPEFNCSKRDTAFIDLAKAPFPWHIRPFKPGDRIIPLGMTGAKKVKDLFIDEKVPLAQRNRIPLIFSNDKLIWVCGLRHSDLVKIDASTDSMVKAVFS